MKKFFLNLTYLLLSLPIGVVYFTVLVTGFSLGFGLSITLIGIPILLGMIFMTYLLADFERSLTARMLGLEIIKPEARPVAGDSTMALLVVQLRDWNFWRQFIYLVIKMPLGIFTFTLAVTLSSVSLALLAAPLIVSFLPMVDYMVMGTSRVDTMSEALLASAGGLALGAVTVFAVNGVSWALGRFTRWSLGAKTA
jgi:hypothetical protein